jgi:phenylalanyl-tRNA synthetase alpha chain
LQELDSLQEQFSEDCRRATSLHELEELRVGYLGKKGQLTSLLRKLGSLPLEERKGVGSRLNSLKDIFEEALKSKERVLEEVAIANQLLSERIDITLPGIQPPCGHRHPLLRTLEGIEDIFLSLGFDLIEGPEVEWDDNNFEALNMPAEHPARDAWDTYYITDQMLLRTHTSPVQVRTMKSQKPPIRAIMPGRTYRHEAIDATHMDVFYQLEGLVVDRGISFADLKGILGLFVREAFGPERQTRFVPSYFPFTEPSAEMLVSCGVCRGAGCPSCGHSGWLEIMGCGQVHPRVLHNCGIDPEEFTGFAFGMGAERIAMLRFNIPEIRLFLENDWPFLEQF